MAPLFTPDKPTGARTDAPGNSSSANGGLTGNDNARKQDGTMTSTDTIGSELRADVLPDGRGQPTVTSTEIQATNNDNKESTAPNGDAAAAPNGDAADVAGKKKRTKALNAVKAVGGVIAGALTIGKGIEEIWEQFQGSGCFGGDQSDSGGQ